MTKLTQYERRKGKELMDRIKAAGIPVAAESPKDEAPFLVIRQNFEAYESTIFSLNGGAGLILPLQITVDTPVFVFCGVDITLAKWPNVWFRPLTENDSDDWPHYNFYGRSNLKFHRDETINRILAEQRQFRRGDFLRGLLLAFSFEPMPDDIVRGAVLTGSIKIYDQFERENCGKISLSVDREAERVPKLNPLRRRLFSRPDLIAGSEGPNDGKE